MLHRTRRMKRQSQKGGDEFLTHKQHAFLKLTLQRLGPSYFKIEDVWNYMNRTAKKDLQQVASPDLIFQYVFAKTLSPENTAWSLVDNQYIRYIPPKRSQSGYTVKNIYTHKNRK